MQHNYGINTNNKYRSFYIIISLIKIRMFFTFEFKRKSYDCTVLRAATYDFVFTFIFTVIVICR